MSCTQRQHCNLGDSECVTQIRHTQINTQIPGLNFALASVFEVFCCPSAHSSDWSTKCSAALWWEDDLQAFCWMKHMKCPHSSMDSPVLLQRLEAANSCCCTGCATDTFKKNRIRGLKNDFQALLLSLVLEVWYLKCKCGACGLWAFERDQNWVT